MADSLELPELFVEGNTDLYLIVQLLARHGVTLDKNLGPVRLKDAKNDKGVLDAMRTAARASTNRAVGFVIDADKSVASRWQAICDRLKDLGLGLPPSATASGFIGESAALKTRVGVWIMPDNATDAGNLEDLVQTLVSANDGLFPHAKSATDKAFSLDPRFVPQDRSKAELYCWLAWQREPGVSFGEALKFHFLRHDSEVARTFVAWFKTLFQLK
ncbi:hypothetical protein RAS1_29130 [Phycisphaerae bacterium RAS1]|nr:hypothetical protein RAS1_29130 [Phycisphaerae bacterium RAS1]